MSAMANTTPIVTTVTKTAIKEKSSKETDAAPRVNILDFCEEHYEEILSVIMDKTRRDKRKEVHTTLGITPRKVEEYERALKTQVRGPCPQGAARVWFDELPPESIDGYKDLKAAFLAYFMQQKKYVKDPVEIHNIKQRDGETIEDFMERFKVETGRMKGALELLWESPDSCMGLTTLN
ncbi:reverse transcriptase domain-containing protein [Tanacetum coccineum]